MRLFKRKEPERPEVVVGSTVFTADHDALGLVRAMESGLMQIEPPGGGGDFWVSEHHVRSANETETLLDFPKERLPDFTAKAPVIQTAEGTKSFDEIREKVLSAQEQDEVRERMERELAEQRRKLQG